MKPIWVTMKGRAGNRRVWIAFHKQPGIVHPNEYRELSPKYSQSVHNHSPDGFAWGYGGSGPSQLALAVLLEAADHAGATQQMAKRTYMKFKDQMIANLNIDSNFEISFKLEPEFWNE